MADSEFVIVDADNIEAIRKELLNRRRRTGKERADRLRFRGPIKNATMNRFKAMKKERDFRRNDTFALNRVRSRQFPPNLFR